MYIVRDQPNPDMPVYVVQREDGSGGKRTLHRNHVLPIGYLHDSDTPRDLRKTAPKKVSMRKDSGIQSTDDTVVQEEGKSNAESETDRVTVHRPRQREVYNHDQPSDDQRDMGGQQDVEAARNASDTSPDVEVVSTPSSSEPATSTSIVIESSHDSTGALTDSQGQSSGSQPGSDTAETVSESPSQDHTDSPQKPDLPQQAVRRSERTRDGAFEVQAIHEAEQDSWSRKVEVLQHLVTTTDLFRGMENEVCRAILNVICEHK